MVRIRVKVGVKFQLSVIGIGVEVRDLNYGYRSGV